MKWDIEVKIESVGSDDEVRWWLWKEVFEGRKEAEEKVMESLWWWRKGWRKDGGKFVMMMCIEWSGKFLKKEKGDEEDIEKTKLKVFFYFLFYFIIMI